MKIEIKIILRQIDITSAAASAVSPAVMFLVINAKQYIYTKTFQNLIKSMHDACFYEIKGKYGKWSARAAQAVAKCRKAKGQVRKSKAGLSLKRWEKEKWKDMRTKKACGAGGTTEYCRPTKKVSSKTPAMPRGKALRKAIRQKVATGHAPSIKRKH